jgi:large subunit ribosomal protein L10
MIRSKNETIDYLTEQFGKYKSFYVIDAGGVLATDIAQFRGECNKSNILYEVAKNTLILLAIKKSFSAGIDESVEGVFKGTSGVMFVGENASLPAKLIYNFRKNLPKDKLLLKGACIDGEWYIGNDKLNELKNLKSKNELIGEIITLLQSPITSVMNGLFNNSVNKIHGIMDALCSK